MPRAPRFFISPADVSGDHITVREEDVRHIVMVLRMKSGDELSLCDGEGTEYRAKIGHIGRNEVTAEIVHRAVYGIPGPRITLGQGLPKSDKMDLIVQKATELGVSRIVPLATERTIVKVRDENKRIARWRKIAREAAMQSCRFDIPQIDGMRSFADFVGTLAPDPSTLLLFPWEEGTEPFKDVLRAHPAPSDIIILIGPEGGFSQAEARLAAGAGFHSVSLGPRILRTETAAVAALSILGHEFS